MKGIFDETKIQANYLIIRKTLIHNHIDTNFFFISGFELLLLNGVFHVRIGVTASYLGKLA